MRVDLRARLMILVAVTVAVMCFSHPGWLLAVIGCELVAMTVLRIRWVGLGRMLRPLLLIMGLVWAATVFVAPVHYLRIPALDRVLFSWGPLTATLAGVVAGAVFVARMLAMLLASWMVLADAEVDEVIDLANHWRLPSSVTTVITCAVATIPQLLTRREQIADAQKARGFEDKGLVGAWRTAVALMVPLMITCVGTAQEMAIALSMRGHGARRRMTVMNRLIWRRGDLLIAVLALLCCVAAPAVRLGMGWGVLAAG